MAHGEIDELERISKLLDSRFRVPGTGIRFGWDSLLGLIPGVGDVATLAPSAYLIYRGHRLGARKRIIARMSANAGIDFIIGSVPLLGDVFDLLFKANNRNILLLKKEMVARQTVQEDAN